jgi:hypothetical protein
MVGNGIAGIIVGALRILTKAVVEGGNPTVDRS